jgi:thymidylate synthase
MNNTDKEYLRVLDTLYTKAKNSDSFKEDRTGTGTISIFAPQIRFDFSEGFPICTTKNVYFKGVKTELLWFLGNHLKDERYADLGTTNIRFLLDNNVHIWDEWSYQDYLEENGLTDKFPKYTEEWEEENKNFCKRVQEENGFALRYGTIGSGYGKQWTDWNGYNIVSGEEVEGLNKGINQIHKVIDILKNNPDSRRILVSAWNVSEIDDMILPPCHYSFQFYTETLSERERAVRWCEKVGKDQSYCDKLTHGKMDELGVPTRTISLLWNQRSCDYFLGIPFNISSYGLLLAMVGHVVNMFPNELVGNLGDCHLYSNHLEQAKEQLSREIKYKLPKLWLNPDIKDINEFTIDDIKLIDYQKDSTIKAPIAV